jgi:hypothetical protein
MNLYVFGDEFGTMPTQDGKQPFVAATLAVLGELPAMPKYSGTRPWLLRQFRQLNVMPHVAFVMPAAGYAARLHSKFDKMNVMARTRRLLDGANAKYLNEDGLNPRNFVWIHCMQQALVAATAKTVLLGPIDGILIHLDQKSMKAGERALFAKCISRTVTNLREELQKLTGQKFSTVALQNLRCCKTQPQLTWSDNVLSPSPCQVTGLILADRLAYYSGKSLM